MRLQSRQLRDFDLNLLRLFQEIYDSKSISIAAKRIGITQPAVSNALRRMRLALKDELFVPTSEGMLATVFAETVAAKVLPLLREIDAELIGAGPFDPATWSQVMRFGVTDYAVTTITQQLIPNLMAQAPNGRIHQIVMKDRNPHDELTTGALDLAIGSFTKEPANFYQKELYTDSFAVITRKNHPILGRKKINAEYYAAAQHLLIAPWGSAWGAVDHSLSQIGLSRVIHITVPYFDAAPGIIANSNLISTVPRQLALKWREQFNLQLLEPPISISDFSISMLWHRRTHKSPAHEWVRKAVANSTQEQQDGRH
ncbi:MAG: LysR family transcriptional regulator [Proteobacteria bacterium]|nr:LysR family transcriptional regulator [Pseudomonadota bacterium]